MENSKNILFKRIFEEKLSQKLQTEGLFKNKLLPDVKSGTVFPAIRKNEMDFYYRGGKLFGYDGDFETHKKFGIVPNYKNDYFKGKSLQTIGLLSFEEGYKEIKDRCNAYSKEEASGVSSLYKYSAWSDKRNAGDIVLLDIEATFFKSGEESNALDIILFNSEDCELRVFEAKHFTNNELWSENIPAAVEQVEKYKEIIKARETEFIEAYSEHIDIMNKIFNKNYAKPITISKEISLLIFGYDSYQKRKMDKQYQYFKNVKLYSIGDIKKIKIENLFNSVNR